MNQKINWRIIIPAILLILPVVLILIFDPAAWKSKSNLISDILGTGFFVDVPIAMCLWHWFRPEHSDTARKMIRNSLLALIPCGILLCGGILSSFKYYICARIVFSVLYPLAGIVMLILFTGTYIFRKPWRKLKKVFAFFLAVSLWLPYMVLPPAVFILVSMRYSGWGERGDIFFIEKSPDPKIEAAYFNDGEFRDHYAVHIQSFNREVAGSPVFHTKASVFQKVNVRWDGSRHFIFESSDVGVIHFRYQNGKWTATPEELLNKEKPKEKDES